MIQIQLVAQQKHQHTGLQQANSGDRLLGIAKTLAIRDAVHDQAGIGPQNVLHRKLWPWLHRHIDNFHLKLAVVLGGYSFCVQQIGVGSVLTDVPTG